MNSKLLGFILMHTCCSKHFSACYVSRVSSKTKGQVTTKTKGKSKLSKQAVPAADDPREQLMVRAVNGTKLA